MKELDKKIQVMTAEEVIAKREKKLEEDQAKDEAALKEKKVKIDEVLDKYEKMGNIKIVKGNTS